MADERQFGHEPGPGSGLRCEDWEALLTDALDGLLPEAQAAAFGAHSGSCANCGDLLAHAKQGQEWLAYLQGEPEVPASLVSKILDKTTGVGAIPVPVLAGASAGTGVAAVAVPWHRNFHETRLLMTVAMAFFSIALTLNMAGVKLTSLRLADLRPATIGNTLSRQFYGAREQVVKFYNNARFVYQLESKVRELRRDTQTQQQQQPQKKQPSGNGDKKGLLAPAQGGEILNAQQRSALGARSSEADLAPGMADLSGQPSKRNELCLRKTEIETEADAFHSLGPARAGQRRDDTAGYEGRSLA